MKELPKYLKGRGEVRGFTFEQIHCSDRGYIYKVTDDQKGYVHYEVFCRHENSLYKCISYPGSKSFGIWAWCTPSLERARVILSQLPSKI